MLEENEKKYDYVADCRDYDLELDRDRQEDINQMIDEVGTWSAEKKQAMKDRMENARDEKIGQVINDVMAEVR